MNTNFKFYEVLPKHYSSYFIEVRPTNLNYIIGNLYDGVDRSGTLHCTIELIDKIKTKPNDFPKWLAYFDKNCNLDLYKEIFQKTWLNKFGAFDILFFKNHTFINYNYSEPIQSPSFERFKKYLKN